MSQRRSWTAAELMVVEFPEPRWAVRGLIPEGVTLLVGAPKLGKSWLALNLGCAVAAGGRALGSIPVEPGDVLYLALEDTGRRLQRRLSMVLGSDPAPERLTLATEIEVLPAGGDERIRAWLHDHPDARLVIVDVLARVRGRTARDVSVYEADYAAVSTLKAIADEFGVAFIIVHHTRKAAADDFLDTVSGSQGLAAAADSVAVLSRSRSSAGAVLKITGRDVEEAEHPLDFDAMTGAWRLLAGNASDYELSDTRRRILGAIRDHGVLTAKQLSPLVNLAHDNVRQTLVRMHKDNQLDTDGNGRYFEPGGSPLSPVTAVTPSLTLVTAVTAGSPVTPVTDVTEGCEQ